MSNDFVNPA